MNLIFSFSARKNGNCDEIAEMISSEQDKIIYLRDKKIQPCMNCDYECITKKECKYRHDDVYMLFRMMEEAEKVYFIVPMYCGNPASLYFILNERSQDYFMNHETYEQLMDKLYILGIYGSEEATPGYLRCFEKWFTDSKMDHILGIERHPYGLKLKDRILGIEELRNEIKSFL